MLNLRMGTVATNLMLHIVITDANRVVVSGNASNVNSFATIFSSELTYLLRNTCNEGIVATFFIK